MKTMTIMKGTLLHRVPWAVVEPHQRRADQNHGQTLERLQERGGLCPSEMYALLMNKRLADVNHATEAQPVAEVEIMRMIADFDGPGLLR